MNIGASRKLVFIKTELVKEFMEMYIEESTIDLKIFLFFGMKN